MRTRTHPFPPFDVSPLRLNACSVSAERGMCLKHKAVCSGSLPSPSWQGEVEPALCYNDISDYLHTTLY